MSKSGPKPTVKRFDWLATRLAAHTVVCRECGAQPGSPCVWPNGRKLHDKPAHLPRIEDTI